MNKTFCFRDLRINTQSFPRLSEKGCLTPQHSRPQRNIDAKNFMNLYLKARSQNHINTPTIKPSFHPKSLNEFAVTKREINSATIIRSSKQEDVFHRQNVRLSRQPTNAFVTERPSQFKISHQREDNPAEVLLPEAAFDEAQPQQDHSIDRDSGLNQEDENRNGDQHEDILQNAITTEHDIITPRPQNDTRLFSTLDDLSKKIFRNYGISLVAYCLLIGYHVQLYSFRLVFSLIWLLQSYLIYYLMRKPEGGQRRINLIFGLVALFGFEVCGFLRLEKVQVPLTMSMIPISFSVFVSCYLNIYRSNGNPQFVGVLVKLLVWLQILFVCLKVDHFLDWSWQKVFCIVWTLLGAASLYCLGLIGMFIFVLCFDRSTASSDPQVVGLSWISFTFSGYVVTFLLLALGFTKELENGDDQHLILGSLLTGVAHVFILAVFTLFQKVKVIIFINQIMGNDDTSSPEPKPLRIKLQKDSYNLPSHIVKFSSSYFLTFSQSLKLKDKQKLKDFQKRVLLIKNGHLKGETSFSIQVKNNKQQVRKLRPLIIPPKNKPYFECLSAFQLQKEEEEMIKPSDILNQKLCFTADDLDYAKQVDYGDFLSNLQTPQLKKDFERDDDKVCIICCDKAADAVIMSCGHGGVCYQCALESCRKSNKCFMCRKKIDKVLHIATNKIPKLNLIKVLSATKIVQEPQSATSTHS